jgi:uncharacterized protein
MANRDRDANRWRARVLAAKAVSITSMRIVLTGATGTIGRALSAALLGAGDRVVALVRSAERAGELLEPAIEIHEWPDPAAAQPPQAALRGADSVVNLLGEPIAQRWTTEAKARIRDSRVHGTRRLVEALGALPAAERPQVLISQSATGFYGPRDDTTLDEQAAGGEDFLAGVVRDWEHEALAAAEHGMRVAVTRTGVVLSRGGGALAKMLPFFRLGIGGPVAGGRQYVPWVHLIDVVGGIRFCLADPQADGAINVTAPNPVTNAELSRALGRALRRPAVLPVPAAALRLLYGDMAQIVLTGQRVTPGRLTELGYAFRFTEIAAALRDVLGTAPP